MQIINQYDLKRFTEAYMECALWSSHDGEDGFLDGSDAFDEWSPEALETVRLDCEAFWTTHADIIEESGMSPDQAGHDFWLTRNGHGTGFWDRGLPEHISKALTTDAHTWGSCDLYIGDDRKLYVA